MDRPNIIWLLTDHHVFKHHMDLGEARPNLRTYDRLCREGVEFGQAQSVCPLCTPARASMLTGTYPHRHGMVVNTGDGGSRREFDPDERLFSHYLVEAGYRVGYFGKWHCGVERLPMDYEFEGWSMPGYGYPYKTDRYAEYLKELGLPEPSVDVAWNVRPPDAVGPGIALSREKAGGRLGCSCGVLTSPIETHESHFVTHMAMKWLEEVAQGGAPFCLRVDVWGPHQPYFVGSPFAGTIDPREISEYPSFSLNLDGKPANHRECLDFWNGPLYSMTWDDWQPVLARCYEHATQVDAALGRVLDAVDGLGLTDDTLIVYTADHGDLVGAHGGSWDKGCLMVEETMRIPMALRWPGRFPAGVASDRLVSNMDVVPTVLEAAGAEIPAPMDGESMVALARDPANAPWRRAFMCESHGHYRQRRVQRMLRRGRSKYVAHLDDMDELYDLQDDPYELENRIDDPLLKDELSSLRECLLQQMDQHDDGSDEAQALRRQMAG